MKKLSLILIFASYVIAQINETELNRKFEEIAKQRVTIENELIKEISNPFYVPEDKQEKQSVEIEFKLQAIVQNRAKINGKWYKPGEEIVAGFKVVSVRNGLVGLSDSNVYKELNLKDKNVTIVKK